MRYSIRRNVFCALSKDKNWHHWLGGVADDLATKLVAHVKKSTSCRSNREVMVVVLKELDGRGLTNALVKFLSDYYPIALKIEDGSVQRFDQPKIEDKRDLNAHGVFKSYRPYLMTFPQKKIIVDPDLESLNRRTRDFIKNKIGVDYVVVEDRVYIEYFDPKYYRESEKVKAHEVAQYKMKVGV